MIIRVISLDNQISRLSEVKKEKMFNDPNKGVLIFRVKTCNFRQELELVQIFLYNESLSMSEFQLWGQTIIYAHGHS